MKWGQLIIAISLVCAPAISLRAQDKNTMMAGRIAEIRAALDTLIFVQRFQSIETPCLYIDSADHSYADPKRRIINSDYRFRLKTKRVIDTAGIKCLSQYCSRYLRLKDTAVDMNRLIISGRVETTYGYPASSLMQYLGFTQRGASKTKSYFEKMLYARGTFSIYPEDNRYAIRMIVEEKPYSRADTIYGYIEIVKEAFNPAQRKSVSLYFTEMNIEKGDRNNQIFIKFSSTDHYNELLYYTVLAYNTLKNRNSDNIDERANAIWLDNYLKNPACSQCKPIYNSAMFMIRSNQMILPNTEPIPAH